MKRLVVTLVVAGLVVGVGACRPRSSSVPIVIRTQALSPEPEAAAVVGALRTLPVRWPVRTMICGRDAFTVVESGLSAEVVQQHLDAKRIKAAVDDADEDLVVFAVRGADPVVAAAFATGAFRDAVGAVGDVSVDVASEKSEPQVHLDLARLLALDVLPLEALRAVGGASTPEAALVKSSVPRAPSLVKAPLPAPVEGEVRVYLRDVAEFVDVNDGLGRRDGAVSVRVKGSADRRDAVVKAAERAAAAAPAGVIVAVLDDDSVEEVEVVLRGPSLEAAQKELLAIPGVRPGEGETRLRVVVDPVKAALLSVARADVDDLADLVDRGHVVLGNTRNTRVRFGKELTLELASQLAVARTAAGAVRLGDVATLTREPAQRDLLDGEPAVTLRLLLDVGVRKNALASIEQTLRRHADLRSVVVKKKTPTRPCNRRW